VLLFVNILSVIEVLVPRHGTNPLGCRALWHGTALPGLLSAVPGPEWWHGGTTRHGTVKMPCLIVPCLIVPCRAVLVPYRARAARLENFTYIHPIDPYAPPKCTSVLYSTVDFFCSLRHETFSFGCNSSSDFFTQKYLMFDIVYRGYYYQYL